jgi:4-amino-4-deoxy-L-arabinose transferase-like glycosyltransferase
MMESARILTESTYIFFIMAGLWLYVDVLLRDEQAPQWGMVALVGAVFGLATLTRAVALLFPIGLAGHLILVRWRISWRQAVLAGLLLLVCHGAVTLTWTARNGLLYDRFIIGSDQMTAALWRGATTEDGSPQENDALLGEQTPAEQAREIIASDVMGYLQRRLSEWRDAYLQPYGTEALGDESLKALVQVWATNGFQVNDLHAIITSEHFVTKLAIYIWHYTGLLGGLIGMGLTWRRWRFTLPLIGFMVYTSLLHLVLLALPRYLFPLYPIWWIFAPITLLAMWDFLTKKRGDRAKAMPSSVSGEY